MCVRTAAASTFTSSYAREQLIAPAVYDLQMRWISGAYELEIGQSVWTKKTTFALPAGVNGEIDRPVTSRVWPDAASATRMSASAVAITWRAIGPGDLDRNLNTPLHPQRFPTF